MSGCSGALKPDRLGLSCKSNKYIDAGTEDLGVRNISVLLLRDQLIEGASFST